MVFLASAWGYPNIEDLFMLLAERQTIEVNSFTTPGITMGLEFNDGKIMLNNIESILKINWNLITERVGKEDLIKKIERCELIGLGYWAVILEFEEIFVEILNTILPSVNNLKKRRR